MIKENKKLVIVGDPIEDIYAKVQDGKTLETSILLGGATNTYINAKAICFDTCFFHNIFFVPELKFTDKYIYKILRLNNQPDVHLCKTVDKSSYYSDIKYSTQRQLNLILDRADYNSVIVFSDYNKGTINIPIHRYKGISKVFLAIVDSKYNSLDSTLFDYADNYIFRCTGSEYNIDFAKQFIYTIWTDGPNQIKLLDKNQNIIWTTNVPSVNVVDSCGAGDTFTAALGVFLFKNTSLDIENIKQAIQFSISASLNVIQKSKTAITDIKI